jgi:site-specific recombinase XerD
MSGIEAPPPVSLDIQSHPVRNYIRAAVSKNTQRAYRSDLRHFRAWGGSIPATDHAIAEYIAAHGSTLSVATLVRRLAAISKAHTTQGLSSPTSSELVRMTLRGIRRMHGKPQRRVAAAIKSDVLAMIEGLGARLKDTRDRALLLIGFAGAFRRSELVGITAADIERTAQGIVITLPRSKTDQDGEGRRIGIPYARGRSCPIKALDGWLASSGQTGHASDAMLQRYIRDAELFVGNAAGAVL